MGRAANRAAAPHPPLKPPSGPRESAALRGAARDVPIGSSRRPVACEVLKAELLSDKKPSDRCPLSAQRIRSIWWTAAVAALALGERWRPEARVLAGLSDLRGFSLDIVAAAMGDPPGKHTPGPNIVCMPSLWNLPWMPSHLSAASWVAKCYTGAVVPPRPPSEGTYPKTGRFFSTLLEAQPATTNLTNRRFRDLYDRPGAGISCHTVLSSRAVLAASHPCTAQAGVRRAWT